MFGRNRKIKTIEVEFIEESSNELFTVSSLSIDQLPDTFEVDTTLHIGDEDWSVVRAVPSTKSEFEKSGCVQVFITKSLPVDPQQILFSIPSISNDLASTIATDSMEDVFVVHEDDWRQCEIVSNSHASDIHIELTDILQIVENNSVSIGFENIHVRKRITKPFTDRTLPLSLLHEHFTVVQTMNGVGFSSQVGIIDRGFALVIDSGWIIWGQLSEDKQTIDYLCLNQPETNIQQNRFTEVMDTLLLDYHLSFVDWNRLVVISPPDTQFLDYVKVL